MALPTTSSPAKHNDSDSGSDSDSGADSDCTFEDLGLDPRLIRALSKQDITVPTPIQRAAIPLVIAGKDVVARAKTGSGKTFAYLLPMLQNLLTKDWPRKSAPRVFILVPTRELCQQVHSEVLTLIELCRVQYKAVQLLMGMSVAELKSALAGPPDILISTPACVAKCLPNDNSKGRNTEVLIQGSSIKESIKMLILDEGDLLLSHGYKGDLETLIRHVPLSCQNLLMSATSSSDVEELKHLFLHDPVTLTLSETKNSNDDIIPTSVQQFWISCSTHDKLLYLLALLKLELVQKKVLIFVNSIDMGIRVKLFLEKFGIRSAVLNAELPQNSRLHIFEQFNAGLFDYLVATDDSQLKQKEHASRENNSQVKNSKKNLKQNLDSEFSAVRGLDFKYVYTVINFDMPQNTAGYVHRIGRTGRAHNTGSSISLVAPEEAEVFKEINLMLGDDDNQDGSKYIAPFPLLTKNAVESLRYRAQDVGKSVTKVAIRESRAQDLRHEILNSEKLKAHFEHNPSDLDLLKHDKMLSKKAPPPHLRELPEYLVDPVTREASKIVKLSRAAMGLNTSSHRKPFMKRFGKRGNSNTLSEKKPRKGEKKRKDTDDFAGRHKKEKKRKDTDDFAGRHKKGKKGRVGE